MSDTESGSQQSSSPAPLQDSSSPRLGLAGIVSVLAATAVSIFALTKVAQLLSSPCGDNRWMWGLAAAVAIAAPTSIKPAIEMARAIIKR